MIDSAQPPYRELLELLICPHTRAPLYLDTSGTLQSIPDGPSYPIIDGIPILVPQADNQSPSDYLSVEISILILALNEAGNIGIVIEGVRAELIAAEVAFEVIVIDGGSTDGTPQLASDAGARVIAQTKKGYAYALIEGFKEVRGRFVLTLDADCSHNASLIRSFLIAGGSGRIVIGSRWMPGGGFSGPLMRHLLSRWLNFVFTRVLAIPISDISSGYRLYDRALLHPDKYKSKDFSILEEILVHAYTQGYDLIEIPLRYEQRNEGASHARLVAFAVTYLKTLHRMWYLRHNAAAADYDSRAYDSINLIQRWWQRRRVRSIRLLMGDFWRKGKVIDVGSGSSRIIQSLPHAVAFDVSLKKLRFLRTTNRLRLCGTAEQLPFHDNTFECIVCSQLIDQLSNLSTIIAEFKRVLRPGGILILGTVDFGRWAWPTIRYLYNLLMPQAYSTTNTSHYSLATLHMALEQNGFRIDQVIDILHSEIIIRAVRL